jgi:hypothetical protein
MDRMDRILSKLIFMTGSGYAGLGREHAPFKRLTLGWNKLAHF